MARYRGIDDVTPKQATEILLGITQVTLDETFVDDHLLGANVTLTLHSGKRMALSLPWIGWEGCAAIRYANACPDAKADLLAILRDRVQR